MASRIVIQRLMIGLVLTFVGCASPRPAPVSCAPDAPAVPIRADADWDSRFTRSTGWTGADGAYSIDLHDGRTLWLFGDTWIGSVAEGKHAAGSTMVNNTIAVHPTPPPGSGRPPGEDEITFFWATEPVSGGDAASQPAERPAAWFRPPASRTAAPDSPADARQPWFWPLDGVQIPSRTGAGGTLVLFLAQIERTPDDRGVWSFQGAGGVLAVIDNPHDPPPAWRARFLRNPYCVSVNDAKDGAKELNWGAAVYADSDWLYVYGIRETHPLNKQALLARVPLTAVDRFDRWEFCAGVGDGASRRARWSPTRSEAVAVAENLVNEFTVERMGIGETDHLVMVQSEPLLGDRILIRLADRPEGPWSAPRAVFRVPGVQKNKSYFTYAAKGHAHLSAAGELLISYVINSTDFWTAAADADIYHPRFIHVPLSALFPE